MLRPIFQSFITLQDKNTLIDFQEERYVDIYRKRIHKCLYRGRIIPDESKEAIKRELANLKLHEYIETVKDRRYLNVLNFRCLVGSMQKRRLH